LKTFFINFENYENNLHCKCQPCTLLERGKVKCAKKRDEQSEESGRFLKKLQIKKQEIEGK